MEEVKKLIEKGIGRITALIVYWNKLSQEDKEALDFKTLSEVWGSFPDMSEKKEIWSLLKKSAVNFNHYVFLLETTNLEDTGDGIQTFFSVLEKKAKSFNQKLWLWENINRYSEQSNEIGKIEMKKEIWDELKKKTKTLKLAAKLWMATKQNSSEEKEALNIIKKSAKEFSDYEYMLEGVFSSATKEWEEIYSLAKKKAVSFEDYLCLWQHESDPEKEEVLWNILWEKAETLEQAIDLFLYSNNDEAAQRLVQVRAKL